MRWKKNIYTPSELNKYNYVFYGKKKNLAGRSKSGYILVYSKGRKKSNYYLNFDKCRVWSKQSMVVTGYNFFKKNNILGVVKYVNGSVSLIKLAHGLTLGSILKTIMYSVKIYKFLLLGCRVNLSILRKNTLIFDVSLNLNGIPSLARASGTYCQILNIVADLGLVLLKLPSLRKKYVSKNCLVTLGRNSNIHYKFCVQGSATDNYRSGIKPIVRGVAMNPVDHPHGGRTKTNKPEVSPWGWVTKHSH